MIFTITTRSPQDHFPFLFFAYPIRPERVAHAISIIIHGPISTKELWRRRQVASRQLKVHRLAKGRVREYDWLLLARLANENAEGEKVAIGAFAGGGVDHVGHVAVDCAGEGGELGVILIIDIR